MRRVWMIGGTADARALADLLVEQGYSLLVTLATEQGGEIWKSRPGLEARVGRLTFEQMAQLVENEEFLALVDGSHPYAKVVSDQAFQVAQSHQIPYFRLGRNTSQLVGDVRVFEDVRSAGQFLSQQEGRIFSTLGSKELDQLLSPIDQVQQRVVARVLPSVDVMEKCRALGLTAGQVIAMMGPFSKEMNLAMFKQAGAKWLVTKDGGAVGGTPEKLEAAAELGMTVVMIGRPEEKGETLSQQQIVEHLSKLSGSWVLDQGVPACQPSLPFPLFLNLQKPVLVVGGGPVACRRTLGMLQWGLSVRLISPSLKNKEMLKGYDGLTWLNRPYEKGDCAGASLVVACTNSPEVNAQIAKEARSLGIMVNRSDDHGGVTNDFIFPALIRRGDDLAAISTAGASPLRCAALASKLRANWQEWCDEAPLGRPLRLGTRSSALAMAQSALVAEQIHRQLGLECQLVPICTTGDALLDRRLDKTGGKGLFAREIEKALRDGTIDFAVHSLKDMPMTTDSDLTFVALIQRAHPFDCLVLRNGFSGMPQRIGTSSRRRILQGSALFPEALFLPLRGNLTSRLEKLDRGEFDGLIVAHAGMERLGLATRISQVFSVEQMVPSAGQGALAIQCRSNSWAASLLATLDDLQVRMCCEAERSFVEVLGGGCTAPHGCYVRMDGDQVVIDGLFVDQEGGLHRGNVSCASSEARDKALALALSLKGTS